MPPYWFRRIGGICLPNRSPWFRQPGQFGPAPYPLISGVQFMAARALTFFKGQWLEGNPGIIGPMSHCMWLSSVVFDGARAFEGVTPDLDLHCERVITSAHALGLAPMLTA